MNKRFCTLGQRAAKALFLFAVCGATYSCKDDYFYDDTNPSWLGSSIYEYLEGQGNYTNFVKLINDLDYREVLARTGSKTLFVANDDAFNTFYQNNAWGVRSYDQLTKSQKKLLLNGVMINNSYLLEMMSSTATNSTDDNARPNQGECLRRETASDVTDSIPHLFGADLPVTYNTDEKDYWARFRDKGIYLALDATAPMMTHFLATQMANKNITDEDFSRITGQTRSQKDAFVYDSKVVEQDITCENGYINRLDKVFITPANMAEVLRTDSRTKIFSHLLDRFSAPFYNATLTERYRLLHGNAVDSVFQKRYFAERSQGSNLNSDQGTDPIGNPNGNTVTYQLNFDPGWNAYRSASTEKEVDMGVIFCPSDTRLKNYFFSDEGGGRFLVKAYAPEYANQVTAETTDLDLIYHALDKIPLEVIQALLNNLMKESFINSVPSKFETVKNDAQDPMFDESDDYHRAKITDVLMANNGIIYLMDEVISPAKYAAVSAPAYVETDKRIFNWAIQAQSLGGIRTDYSAYLLAMSSRFSFFVPSDESFWYVDPVSFFNPDNTTTPGSLIGRIYNYTWNGTSNAPTVKAYRYTYNLATGAGVQGDATSDNISMSGGAGDNRLKDMLETHTIIHEDEREMTGIDETQTGMECNKHYFISKNNVPIYIENATSRNSGMTAQGGLQVTSGDISRVTAFDDKSQQTNGYGNGYAYTINSPVIPTIESVYSVLYNNPDFQEFYELCKTDAEVLTSLGITGTDQNKYFIFTNNGGLPCYDKTTGALVERSTNVRFFNNYQYTVYVPTNEAIQAAVANGLPTWQSIRNYLYLDDPTSKPEMEPEEEAARTEKAKAMVTCLLNFVKNHFQDKSIFADTNPVSKTAFETSTLNILTNIYCKVSVSGGSGTLTVQDEVPGSSPVSITSNKNIIARDYLIRNGSSIPAASDGVKDLKITASSSAVIHGLNGVLNFKALTSGRYDGDWATAAKARNFLREFGIKE